MLMLWRLWVYTHKSNEKNECLEDIQMDFDIWNKIPRDNKNHLFK